jgi:hypothetical protein
LTVTIEESAPAAVWPPGKIPAYVKRRTQLTPDQRAAFVGKRVFTTGEVATLFGVAPRTVGKWFDTGRIKGFRLPPSGDRRMTRDSLLLFAEEMRNDEAVRLLAGGVRQTCLLALDDAQLASWLSARLDDVVNASVALDLFTAGVAWERVRPVSVALDFRFGSDRCRAALALIARCQDRSHVVAVVPEDFAGVATELAALGFAGVWRVGADPLALLQLLTPPAPKED